MGTSDRDLDLGNFIFGTLTAINRVQAKALAGAPPPQRPALRADALYLGDNGRAFCGLLTCAGSTAYWSGRDLSGQPVEVLTPQEAHEYRITCEKCGMQPMLVVPGRG